MGTGSSFMQEEDGDLISDNGVIKRIPIEVKPRRTLRGSIRNGPSFIRRNKGSSLRSALSVDLENTEVEKIRKEFEMYKISNQNETSELQKKQQKLESENRRLRAELQALQKTCAKLRYERDMALDAEYQALQRAATFENERDKVQRQFKVRDPNKLNPSYRGCKSRQGEAQQLKNMVKESGKAKVIDNYENPLRGTKQAYVELERIVKLELGIELTESKDEGYNEDIDSCSGTYWDSHNDYEHLEAFSRASFATCDLGSEKHYGQLNDYVSAAGPLPPLLISGSPGSGKSLLLAKWISTLNNKHASTLVLYHFVGGQQTISADPVHMTRRLTAQLMQHVTTPPPLTCDPSRLLEEFPKWLEKVSARLPGGVVLAIDAIDNLQNAETNLKWLLDPLAVDTRVVVSVDMDNCPSAWRSWPTIHLEPFSSKQVKELLLALSGVFNFKLSSEHESRILAHCRTPSTRNPLYLNVLMDEMVKGCSSKTVKERLDACLKYPDVVELYRHVMESLEIQREDATRKGMFKKVMQFIYASRNGLSECEIMKILPDLTWSFWSPINFTLQDRHILTCKSGLLTFEHEQAREAVQLSYCSGIFQKELLFARKKLIDFYSMSLQPGLITWRVVDELPWLIQSTSNKEELTKCISNLCVFRKLYTRGRCAELIRYWQYVGADKTTMATAYLNTIKKCEEMIGGLITLPRIAEIYETLGRFLKDLGLLKEAIAPLQKALEIYESLDPDHPSVAGALYQLAGLHAQWNKFVTAEALYKQSLEISENAYGCDHQNVAKILDAMVVLYQKQEKTAEAYFKKALDMRVSVSGCDHTDVAQSLNNLAALYNDRKEYSKAEPLYERALEIRQKSYPVDHPSVASTIKHLAVLYKKQGKFGKAEPLYRQAVGIREKSFGVAHPSVATALVNLAVLYCEQNKQDEALPLYERALHIYEDTLGANHVRVAETLRNLAVLRYEQSDFETAAKLYKRSTEIKEMEQAFGNKAPSRKSSIGGVSTVRNLLSPHLYYAEQQ
ncbi:nephrocystin-3-like [Saccoglossus kowalevskii]